MDKNETRIWDVGEFEVRAKGDGDAPEIVGYASVYNQLSEDLGGFREIVRPGFFKPVLDNDVRATINHSPAHVLGRNKAGTLFLEDDDTGLRTRIVMPDTSYARDLMVSVERGDVNQMSFVFRVAKGGEKWHRDDDGEVLRELFEAQELRDVSVVTYPAYPQTSAEARAKAKELTGEVDQAVPSPDEMLEKTKAQARRSILTRKIELKKRS